MVVAIEMRRGGGGGGGERDARAYVLERGEVGRKEVMAQVVSLFQGLFRQTRATQ